MAAKPKPRLGFYTFTCCEGCQFRLLFIDSIMEVLDKFTVLHFNVLKEKNEEAELDLAFVEGAITTEGEIAELKDLRRRTGTLVALGTCAVSGGIPAMKNFVNAAALHKYVYHHVKHHESVPAGGIGEYVEVDFELRGCPIIEKEFIQFVETYLSGSMMEPFQGPVCTQCPRRSVNCFLKEKSDCMGSITHGGCGGLCTGNNIPCTLCRGPLDRANIQGEIKLFEKFGLEEREIRDRLNMFKNIEERIV